MSHQASISPEYENVSYGDAVKTSLQLHCKEGTLKSPFNWLINFQVMHDKNEVIEHL